MTREPFPAHLFYTASTLVRFPHPGCGAAYNRARMSYSHMMPRSGEKLHSSSSPRNNITCTVPCISCYLPCGTVPDMEISLSQEHPYTSINSLRNSVPPPQSEHPAIPAIIRTGAGNGTSFPLVFTSLLRRGSAGSPRFTDPAAWPTRE